MTDKERLDWLEKQQGAALVSDDHSHWAVVTMGMQNIPEKWPGDIETCFFITKKEWKKSIRKAIDAEMKRDKEGNDGFPVMLTVSDKSYKCRCGCNVFTKVKGRYKCNACGSVYEEDSDGS